MHIHSYRHQEIDWFMNNCAWGLGMGSVPLVKVFKQLPVCEGKSVNLLYTYSVNKTHAVLSYMHVVTHASG